MNATAEAPAASKTPSRHVAESMDGVRLQDGLPRLMPARLVEFIERELPYRFAATMPGVPHEYAHRNRVEDEERCWGWLLKEWDTYAVRRKWNNYRNSYLTVNGYQYWTMDTKYLLNRCPVRYEWDPAISGYDAVSAVYDERFMCSDSVSKKRHGLFRELIGLNPGSVLDIGCGTGSMIDYLFKPLTGAGPENYLGIDPSLGMVGQARLKHGHRGFQFQQARFEDYQPSDGRRFDTVAAMFGSASYVHDVDIVAKCKALAKPAGRVVLMFYPPFHEGDPLSYRYTGLGKLGIKAPPDPLAGADEVKVGPSGHRFFVVEFTA
ncbi:MAG: class I SAM-dependent methyltransferase [Bryobacterales bacterium]|nr:class I SAM-dependent methyltransferase [Bryobacterales bacterium]